jgi:predicted  nucleic acid-binding Zn-ribbon protein
MTKKISNWINNFIEERYNYNANKRFLKNHSLAKSLSDLENKIDIGNFNFKSRNILINQLKDDLEDLKDDFEDLKDDLSIQKGRISRQTNEQNIEKEDTESAFANIFERLEKIENSIRNNLGVN